MQRRTRSPRCAPTAPRRALPAGGNASCTPGAAATLLSTHPGGVTSIASPGGKFLLQLRTTGMLDVLDLSTGMKAFTAGPTAGGCKAPYQLLLMPSGALHLVDKTGVVAWSSGSSCRGDSYCYSYSLQVRRRACCCAPTRSASAAPPPGRCSCHCRRALTPRLPPVRRRTTARWSCTTPAAPSPGAA
jgi:hypothetical protein